MKASSHGKGSTWVVVGCCLTFWLCCKIFSWGDVPVMECGYPSRLDCMWDCSLEGIGETIEGLE